MSGLEYVWILALQNTATGATTSGHGVTTIRDGMTRHDVLLELMATVKDGATIDFSNAVVTSFYLEPNAL
jgi:hypothetical protein